MSNGIKLTGIILSESEYSEYGKRLVILTKEKGKVTVFARGARKQNNPLMGVTMPFTFGVFDCFYGRDAYSLNSVEVREYFEELRNDLDAILYAAYFCELADHFGVENNSDRDLLNLLYVSFKALVQKIVPYPLIRRIYEMRLLKTEGLGVNVFSCVRCGGESELYYFSAEEGGLICSKCLKKGEKHNTLSESVLYTMQFIYTVELKKLYSFNVTDEVLEELSVICNSLVEGFIDRKLKSLEMLVPRFLNN